MRCLMRCKDSSLCLMGGMVLALFFTFTSVLVAQSPAAYFRLVRVIETGKMPETTPAGLAFSPRANAFLFLESQKPDQQNRLDSELRSITSFGEPAVSVTLPMQMSDPLNFAFDFQNNRLAHFNQKTGELVEVRANPDGRLSSSADAIRLFEGRQFGLTTPQGMAFDLNGRLYILNATPPRIIRITPGLQGGFDGAAAARDGRISRIELDQIGPDRLRGIAFDPGSNHLHVLGSTTASLYELTEAGQVVAIRDLSSLRLRDPQSMLFAASGDQTDHPALMSLYISTTGQARGGKSRGQIVELSLTAPPAPDLTGVARVEATLVNTIHTSQWSPPSPDPMGIAYLSSADRFLIIDSEVEEMAIFAGANAFEATLPGVLTRTFNTTSFSTEPTGIAFNPSNQHLFISDDNEDEVFEIDAGADGIYFTADDHRTSFDTRSIDHLDAEDLAFDDWQGHLFVAGGVDAEVYELKPGPNQIFDGQPPLGDDERSHFDTARLGLVEPEGIEFDSESGHLFITGRNVTRVVETTRTGTPIRLIDISFLNDRTCSGLAHAPSSVNPAVKSLYISTRGVDNDTDPNENDGKVYEISIDPPPSVPSIYINNVSVAEGDTGVVAAMFTVLLSNASKEVVTVDYATSNGTASGDSDFVAGSGSLRFPQGTTTQAIVVAIKGDTLDEPNETFFIDLRSARNAIFVDKRGRGIITDDDVLPPVVAAFSPTSGAAGAEVTINGSNFIGAISVKFNGTPAAAFTVDSTAQIRAVVPSASTTGKISVTTPGGSATSAGNFTVIVPATLTFNPTDDARVNSTTPTTNYGDSGTLRLRRSNFQDRVIDTNITLSSSTIVNSYLKFNVRGLSGPVQSARLRLYVTDASTSGGSVHVVTNEYKDSSTPWTEEGLTWDNAEAIGDTALSAVGTASIGSWVEFDVTAAVTEDAIYSFGLKTSSADAVDYSSKEGANAPQLVVQTDAGELLTDKHSGLSEQGNEAIVSSLPKSLDLAPNYPNPFNAQCTIAYALPQEAKVRLAIYNILGREVRRLIDENQPAGYKKIYWNGRDDLGIELSTGIYLVELLVNTQRLTRKITMMK